MRAEQGRNAKGYAVFILFFPSLTPTCRLRAGETSPRSPSLETGWPSARRGGGTSFPSKSERATSWRCQLVELPPPTGDSIVVSATRLFLTMPAAIAVAAAAAAAAAAAV